MISAVIEESTTKSKLLDGPIPSSLPAWFMEDQADAWKKFQTLAMPVRTDERWRFSGINHIKLDAYDPAPAPSSKEIEQAKAGSIGVCGSSGQMILLNDHVAAKRNIDANLASKGVVWMPLSEALASHAGLFREHFMAHFTGLGAEKFALLHKSFVREGVLVYVPDNVEIDLPLENFYWVGGDSSSVFPHTLIITGANSKVTVIDYFQGLEGTSGGFACGVNDLFVGDGSKVTYVSAQNWPAAALSFQFNSTLVGRDATVTSLATHLGGIYNRSESVSHLTAPGGRSDMLAVTLATGSQEFDQRTLQDHQQPSTASDLLYKNALDQTARTIFSGLIKVEPGAHHTDAYQKVRNLLLSDEAEANSMPGLEILADDVRCTHGATGGQMNADELFYLKSRGLTDRMARRLIVAGFLEEVFSRLDQPAILERFGELIEKKLLAQ